MKFILKYKQRLSEFGLLYAAFIWGSTFVIVKNSLDSIDPIILVGYRFLLAGLIMLPFLLFQRKKIFQNIKHGIILGILLWFLYAPQTLGLKFTSASNSVLITGLFIVFVPIFGYFLFKKIPSVFQVISIGISLIGFWLLTGGMNEVNIGDLLTIVTASAYALHIITADRLMKKNHDPFVLSFQQFMVVGLISLFIGAFFNFSFTYGSMNTVWMILFLAIFPGLSAFVIQLVAQKNTLPIRVALIFAMEPVFGVFTAWFFGGEQFQFIKAIGGGLIILGIFISELQNNLTS